MYGVPILEALEIFVVFKTKPQIQAKKEEILFQEPRGRLDEVIHGRV